MADYDTGTRRLGMNVFSSCGACPWAMWLSKLWLLYFCERWWGGGGKSAHTHPFPSAAATESPDCHYNASISSYSVIEPRCQPLFLTYQCTILDNLYKDDIYTFYH